MISYLTRSGQNQANENTSSTKCVSKLNENADDLQPYALQQELQECKAELCRTKNENKLLNVKARRLEEMLKKKHRIIDMHYQGPHNTLLCKEAIAQISHKAQVLKDENISLKEMLFEKEHQIHLLRRKVSSYSAYRPSKASKRGSLPSSACPSTCKTTPKECNIDLSTNLHASHKDSKEESPHEEIEQLQIEFKGIANEMAKLKQSMAVGNEEQRKTISKLRTREQQLLDELAARKRLEEARLSEERRPKSKKVIRASQRSAMSAFTRVPPKSQQTKHKKPNPFAIRTSSQTSLADENDVKMYIDEVLMDMSRDKLK